MAEGGEAGYTNHLHDEEAHYIIHDRDIVAPSSSCTGHANSSLHGHENKHGHSHSHDHKENYAHSHNEASHGAHSHDMNLHGVFLHILGDFLGTVSVIISTIIFIFCKGEWRLYMDPVVSLFITALIIVSTVPLIKSACYILLQSSPSTLEVDRLRSDVLSIAGVIGIHEFHCWQLSNTKTVASIHVLLDIKPEIYMKLAAKIKQCLHVFNT